MGFMTKAARRSLDTAVKGVTPKTSTRIGVIKAPPPMPVSPTTKPTMEPAKTTQISMSLALHSCSLVSINLFGSHPQRMHKEPLSNPQGDRLFTEPTNSTDLVEIILLLNKVEGEMSSAISKSCRSN
jgi:hypothetical protein